MAGPDWTFTMLQLKIADHFVSVKHVGIHHNWIVPFYFVSLFSNLRCGSEFEFCSWWFQKKKQLFIYLSHRIHGAGIYANMTGVYWWDPWSTIYSSTMDPSWVCFILVRWSQQLASGFYIPTQITDGKPKKPVLTSGLSGLSGPGACSPSWAPRGSTFDGWRIPCMTPVACDWIPKPMRTGNQWLGRRDNDLVLWAFFEGCVIKWGQKYQLLISFDIQAIPSPNFRVVVFSFLPWNVWWFWV